MLALLVGFCRAPFPKGKRVAILTNSGGPGIMATDALVSSGLQMARFSEETTRTLHNTVPPEASIANPIDLTAWGTEEAYRKILAALSWLSQRPDRARGGCCLANRHFGG